MFSFIPEIEAYKHIISYDLKVILAIKGAILQDLTWIEEKYGIDVYDDIISFDLTVILTFKVADLEYFTADNKVN